MPHTATWMDLEMMVLIEVVRKDKHHMRSLICGILKKKKDTNAVICRTETVIGFENKYMVAKGNGLEDERLDGGLGIGIGTLRYME